MKHANPFMFRLVKILGIGYITFMFFLCAVFFGSSLDVFFTNIYGLDYEHKSTVSLVLEICIHVILLGILAYLVRIIVKNIPFPLEGLYGYSHLRLKETDGGVFYALILMFQYHMQEKIIYVAKKLMPAPVVKISKTGASESG